MRDLTVYAPYLDHTLFDFLASLPARLLMDRTLHTEAIAAAWPRFATIPYERKGLLMRDRRATRQLAARLTRAVTRGPARTWLRGSRIVPGLAATVLDGNSERLWGTPLLLWLDQLAEMVTTTAAAARER